MVLLLIKSIALLIFGGLFMLKKKGVWLPLVLCIAGAADMLMCIFFIGSIECVGGDLYFVANIIRVVSWALMIVLVLVYSVPEMQKRCGWIRFVWYVPAVLYMLMWGIVAIANGWDTLYVIGLDLADFLTDIILTIGLLFTGYACNIVNKVLDNDNQ